MRAVVAAEPAGVQPADLAQRSDVALVQALRVLILHEGNRALKGDRRHCAAADKTAARALRLRQLWAAPELRPRELVDALAQPAHRLRAGAQIQAEAGVEHRGCEPSTRSTRTQPRTRTECAQV